MLHTGPVPAFIAVNNDRKKVDTVHVAHTQKALGEPGFPFFCLVGQWGFKPYDCPRDALGMKSTRTWSAAPYIDSLEGSFQQESFVKFPVVSIEIGL